MNNCGTVAVFVPSLPSCPTGNIYSYISDQFKQILFSKLIQPSLIKYLIIK